MQMLLSVHLSRSWGTLTAYTVLWLLMYILTPKAPEAPENFATLLGLLSNEELNALNLHAMSSVPVLLRDPEAPSTSDTVYIADGLREHLGSTERTFKLANSLKQWIKSTGSPSHQGAPRTSGAPTGIFGFLMAVGHDGKSTKTISRAQVSELLCKSVTDPRIEKLKTNTPLRRCTLHCANVLLGPRSEIGKTLRPLWSVFISFIFCIALNENDAAHAFMSASFDDQLDEIKMVYNLIEQMAIDAVSEEDVISKVENDNAASKVSPSGDKKPPLVASIIEMAVATLRAVQKYSTDESVRMEPAKRLLDGVGVVVGPWFMTKLATALGIPGDRGPQTPLACARMETEDKANEMATLFAADGKYLVCVISKDVYLMSMTSKQDITTEDVFDIIGKANSPSVVDYIDDKSLRWATCKKSEKDFPVLFRGYTTLFYGTLPNAGASHFSISKGSLMCLVSIAVSSFYFIF